MSAATLPGAGGGHTEPICDCGGDKAAYVMDTTPGAGHAATCPVRIAHPFGEKWAGGEHAEITRLERERDAFKAARLNDVRLLEQREEALKQTVAAEAERDAALAEVKNLEDDAAGLADSLARANARFERFDDLTRVASDDRYSNEYVGILFRARVARAVLRGSDA